MVRFAALSTCVLGASGLLMKKQGFDPSVKFSDKEVFGRAAGGVVDECITIPPETVASKTEPRVEVCGTSNKAIVYLLNDCEDYKTVEIGACDTSMPPDTCQSLKPGDEGAPAGFETFQSYKIVPCDGDEAA
ncbi:unnamed protein product [Amoebophrya sp. A25]|nr:unnamed protein product [Amoebophrya sp. A25]|eukprot:GSA25T00021681001.1